MPPGPASWGTRVRSRRGLDLVRPGDLRPECLCNLDAGPHAVLVKSIARPGTGKPGTRSSLDPVQLLLRRERGRTEYRVVVFKLRDDRFVTRLAKRIQADEIVVPGGQPLQRVHPVGHADGPRRVIGRFAQVIPGRPDTACPRHQRGVAVQKHTIRLIRYRAEHLALRLDLDLRAGATPGHCDTPVPLVERLAPAVGENQRPLLADDVRFGPRRTRHCTLAKVSDQSVHVGAGSPFYRQPLRPVGQVSGHGWQRKRRKLSAGKRAIWPAWA